MKHYNLKEIPLVAKYSLAFTNATNISPYRDSTATKIHKPKNIFLIKVNVLILTIFYFQNSNTACRHSYARASACGLCASSAQQLNGLVACLRAFTHYADK